MRRRRKKKIRRGGKGGEGHKAGKNESAILCEEDGGIKFLP